MQILAPIRAQEVSISELPISFCELASNILQSNFKLIHQAYILHLIIIPPEPKIPRLVLIHYVNVSNVGKPVKVDSQRACNTS